MKVEKEGVVLEVRDEHQLAAFLNNGWEKVVDESQATKAKKITEK